MLSVPLLHFAVMLHVFHDVVVFTPVLAPFDNAGIVKLHPLYPVVVFAQSHDGISLQLLPL